MLPRCALRRDITDIMPLFTRRRRYQSHAATPRHAAAMIYFTPPEPRYYFDAFAFVSSATLRLLTVTSRFFGTRLFALLC